jgi:hypothetical protein
MSGQMVKVMSQNFWRARRMGMSGDENLVGFIDFGVGRWAKCMSS